MCEKCQELRGRINEFQCVLAHHFDQLTKERLRESLTELEAEKAALHTEPQVKAPQDWAYTAFVVAFGALPVLIVVAALFLK
ncbi:hypothetical protein AC629_02740 [Bradyrhizobium sp. NAS80.1]|nr:hypothetical protein AC629_02740 [Bradyrhizobium sp. NAS80.1]